MIDPASLQVGQTVYTVKAVWGVEFIPAVVKRMTKATVWLERNASYKERLTGHDFAAWYADEREAKERALEIVRVRIKMHRDEVAKYQAQESELVRELEAA